VLWPVFAKTHARFRTPHAATIVVGALVSVIAGVLPIGILVQMVSIGTLFAFIVVCVGVMVLRYREPRLPRAFRAPWVPFVPIAGVVICFAQMAALPLDAWLRLLVWMLLGFAIYFIYGIKHSKARQALSSMLVIVAAYSYIVGMV
jgi:APA family basic amino acid/polyamine antiporter